MTNQPFTVRNHAFLPLKTTMPSPAGYLIGGWTKRRAAKIAAAQLASDQSDFVALIRLTDSNFRTVAYGGHVTSASGFDIVFSAGDGMVRLPHETVSYDASAGTITAWVRFPTLLAAVDNPFYVYYANAAVTATSDRPFDVWAGIEQTVLHGGIASGKVTDSGGGARHGKIVSTVSVSTGLNSLPAFQLAGGAVQVPTLPISHSETVSMWYKAGSQAGSAVSYILACVNTIVAQGLLLSLNQASNGGGTHKLNFSAQNKGAGAATGTYSNSLVDDGMWHHLALVFDETVGTVLYHDGVSVATSVTKNTECAPSKVMNLGQYVDGTGRLAGYMSEVRFARSAKTAARLIAERTNYLSFTTFAVLTGAETAVASIASITTEVPITPFSTNGLSPINLVASDHNAFYQPTTHKVLEWDGASVGVPCAPEISHDCWQGADYSQDTHSQWFDYTAVGADPTLVANVTRYLDPTYYQLKPFIDGICCVRTWLCTGDPGSTPCVDATAVNFIQYVETNAGIAGWSDQLIHAHADAQFDLWTYCSACGSNGLNAAIPANKT